MKNLNYFILILVISLGILAGPLDEFVFSFTDCNDNCSCCDCSCNCQANLNSFNWQPLDCPGSVDILSQVALKGYSNQDFIFSYAQELIDRIFHPPRYS
ncbi:MAG: hypothetical protein KJ619_00955 [Candidatus Omnitrophica bacterium]|nr:hypothetical protein [Candidatus Omnitrophota bacterium]